MGIDSNDDALVGALRAGDERPMVTAKTMLGDRFAELRERVIEIWRRTNKATDGRFLLPQEYLVSIVRV